MNRTNYRVSLNIKEIYSPFTISVKRGDTSGRLLVTLMSGGKPFQIPEGCYATFEATRPDSVIIHEGCTVQNNTIIYDMETAVTAVAGKLPCEITLYDLDGTVLISPQFAIIVYQTVFSQETVEGSNEYTSLTTLISEANALINEVETKLENGDFIGDQGVGIDSVEDGETTDEEDYTVTPVRVTKTDGTTTTFNVKAKKGDKGDKGDQGEQGIQGDPGGKGDDGTPATHSWNGTVLTVTSASGSSSADLKGEKGDKGDDGKSISIVGSLASEAYLPSIGETGQGYLINGYLYVWDGSNSKWVNVGQIKGDKGDKGDPGDTPVKGTDYFTESEVSEMVEEAASLVYENLESKTVFIGTMDQYETMDAEGKIPEGTLVFIVDDAVLASDGTSAVLGEAILGKLILG